MYCFHHRQIDVRLPSNAITKGFLGLYDRDIAIVTTAGLPNVRSVELDRSSDTGTTSLPWFAYTSCWAWFHVSQFDGHAWVYLYGTSQQVDFWWWKAYHRGIYCITVCTKVNVCHISFIMYHIYNFTSVLGCTRRATNIRWWKISWHEPWQ